MVLVPTGKREGLEREARIEGHHVRALLAARRSHSRCCLARLPCLQRGHTILQFHLIAVNFGSKSVFNLLYRTAKADPSAPARGRSKLFADPASPTAIDILQFALNLEYLEAEFYTVATAGVTIDQPPYNIPITNEAPPQTDEMY